MIPKLDVVVSVGSLYRGLRRGVNDSVCVVCMFKLTTTVLADGFDIV